MKPLAWKSRLKKTASITIAIGLSAALLSLATGVTTSKAQNAPRVQMCCGDFWAPDAMRQGGSGPQYHGRWQGRSMARHMTFMREGVSSEYRGEQNPLSAAKETIDGGGALYGGHCASCHGARGLGDGEASRGLNPPPALLAHMVRMPMAVDEYLLWSISGGGEAFGTAMPAFKDALTKEEIWQIVMFMRAGFPVSMDTDNGVENGTNEE